MTNNLPAVINRHDKAGEQPIDNSKTLNAFGGHTEKGQLTLGCAPTRNMMQKDRRWIKSDEHVDMKEMR